MLDKAGNLQHCGTATYHDRPADAVLNQPSYQADNGLRYFEDPKYNACIEFTDFALSKARILKFCVNSPVSARS